MGFDGGIEVSKRSRRETEVIVVVVGWCCKWKEDLMDVIMEDNVLGDDDDGLVLCVVVGLVGEDGRFGCLNVFCVN